MNADFDIPFAASINPDNPVIAAGGLVVFNESTDGSPGILGTLDKLGNPGMPETLGKLGTFGSDGIIPPSEVAIELAPPVVVANADEKFPELIALATLDNEGSDIIIIPQH